MVSPISIIINILALTGVIFILGIIIFYIYKYYQKKNHQKIISDIFPPGDYMENTGIKCPDYWVNVGVDRDGKYICENTFNVTVKPKNDFKCYDSNNRAYFTPTNSKKTWQYGNPNGMQTYNDKEKAEFLNIDRCKWINNCGAEDGLNAVWTGVSDICNNPSDGK